MTQKSCLRALQTALLLFVGIWIYLSGSAAKRCLPLCLSHYMVAKSNFYSSVFHNPCRLQYSYTATAFSSPK